MCEPKFGDGQVTLGHQRKAQLCDAQSCHEFRCISTIAPGRTRSVLFVRSHFYHASCPCPRREICVRTLALCNFEVATSYLFPSMVRATGKHRKACSSGIDCTRPKYSCQFSSNFPWFSLCCWSQWETANLTRAIT
jgi:hypothetical protein